MKRRSSKPVTDLHRLLDAQKFETIDDLNKFMEGIIGAPVPEIPEEDLTAQQRAEDMVLEAFNLPPDKAKQQVEEALKLDPDCISAYEVLAVLQGSVESAIEYLEQGIAIGRRLYGGEYLRQNKGMFWDLTETRPFMSCLKMYAECLFFTSKVDESIEVLEEMIALNPNDNQGMRDMLLVLLILGSEVQKFKKYDKMFEDDSMAAPMFNRALFAFTTEGENPRSIHRLKAAMKENKYVAPVLLTKKPTKYPSDSYMYGSRGEAEAYAFYAKIVWTIIPGALKWLKKHAWLNH